MCPFLMGRYATDDTAICDLGALGDFVTVDEKHVLVLWMSTITWKRRLILLGMPLLNLSLSRTFMRCRYSLAFPVSGNTTAFTITCCRVSSPFDWSITDQSSPDRLIWGDGLMGTVVGILIVATWFAMKYFTWRLRDRLLYMCNCGTVGLYFAFWCAAGDIVSVLSGTM